MPIEPLAPLGDPHHFTSDAATGGRGLHVLDTATRAHLLLLRRLMSTRGDGSWRVALVCALFLRVLFVQREMQLQQAPTAVHLRLDDALWVELQASRVSAPTNRCLMAARWIRPIARSMRICAPAPRIAATKRRSLSRLAGMCRQIAQILRRHACRRASSPAVPVTLLRMPLPPPDPVTAPSQTPLQSPRDAAAWAIVYRRRIRERPRERWLRVVGVVGSLLAHLLVLLLSVMGAAYQPLDLPDNDKTPLLVHLVNKPPPPPPPPPPPVRGTPPKQLGPRHQGSASALGKASSKTPATLPSPMTPVAVAAPSIEPPVVAIAAPQATKPEPIAAPLPPASLPKPAPTPVLQPVPLSSEPPPISVNAPSVTSPVPPKFQPEPVRRPQLEGNQPMPPPASLAPVELPPQSSPALQPPTIAVASKAPQPKATPSAMPVTHAELSTAPPVPELQPVPLPAQASPAVNLTQPLAAATPNVPRERPRIQSPSIHLAEQPQPQAMPMAAVALPAPERPQAPSIRPLPLTLPAQPPQAPVSVARPQLSTPSPQATAQAAPAHAAASAPAQPPASASQTDQASQHAATDQHEGRDVSSAPDATPQGSDTATVGQPNGTPSSAQIYNKDGSINLGPTGQGQGSTGQAGQQGQNGSSPSGAQAASGATGPSGTYIQLRPHGDTDILSHGTPKIGYKHTRFEDDWTPLGESSVDTALRHAVEKTTVSHTFHLPRGVRIKCVVVPLLPAALFGCGNGDPPPAPVDDKVYDRMHLAPANPSVPPTPAAVATAPAPLKLDNSTLCASARVSGGPLPPNCEATNAPLPVLHKPASASSSWVPASDQFH